MKSLTRRALLARASAAAAVAGGAGLWPLQRGGTNTEPDSPLTPERRKRYTALVAAVVALEGGRARGAYLEHATGAFAGWYSRNPGLRPMADHVVDEVATAGGPRRLLTDSGADGDQACDALFGTLGNRRRILAGEALRLASPPFAPDRA